MNSAIPAWKRAIDLSAIILSSPVWLTVMGLIAIWIKAVSPGPVFFHQERIGFRGRRFVIHKFRSMHVGAKTLSHENHWDQLIASNVPMTKLDSGGDSRVIPGGANLRKLGFDELPQIFNVLKGDMSLVGPRPCTPREYEGSAELRGERTETVPGLTGYWQINGKNETTFQEMIALDTFYVANMSLGMDLSILVKTVRMLLMQLLGQVPKSHPLT
jgi:lipopolysaccharide/colanic/teichoic acid biosynthesis glycosyltransferase